MTDEPPAAGIELSERQHERFEQVREGCDEPGVPEPTDQQVMKGLLDTWDAVNEGHYSDVDAMLEVRLRKLEERDADKSAAITNALRALRQSTRPLDRRAREARRHLAPFALPRGDDLHADGGESEEPTDDRHQFPDTVAEWKQVAKDEDVALMLEAEEQAVFVAHVETEEFETGEKWISNGVTETGGRANSFATGEELIDRWFREAVANSRLWRLDPADTPLEVERHG